MITHWRHLANTIEFVHPSAHSSPQPKRQMDRFIRFCIAYGAKCLYFTMGAPIHQNCPFPWGIWISHVTHDAFGPHESTTQTANRSVQPFFHRSRKSVAIRYNGPPPLALKIAPSHIGDLDPHVGLIHGSLAHPSPQPKRHLDRFCRFCRAH